MLIDRISPVWRQKSKAWLQRVLGWCAAGAVVLAVAGGAALWHEQHAARIEAMASVSLRDQVWDGRIDTGVQVGGIYAVVNALSGSEAAIVTAVRDCSDGSVSNRLP